MGTIYIIGPYKFTLATFVTILKQSFSLMMYICTTHRTTVTHLLYNLKVAQDFSTVFSPFTPTLQCAPLLQTPPRFCYREPSPCSSRDSTELGSRERRNWTPTTRLSSSGSWRWGNPLSRTWAETDSGRWRKFTPWRRRRWGESLRPLAVVFTVPTFSIS